MAKRDLLSGGGGGSDPGRFITQFSLYLHNMYIVTSMHGSHSKKFVKTIVTLSKQPWFKPSTCENGDTYK